MTWDSGRRDDVVNVTLECMTEALEQRGEDPSEYSEHSRVYQNILSEIADVLEGQELDRVNSLKMACSQGRLVAGGELDREYGENNGSN